MTNHKQLILFWDDHITCLSYTYWLNVIVLHCTDGLKNGDETGLDCGGSCDPCKGMLFNVHWLLYGFWYISCQFCIGSTYNTVRAFLVVLVKIQLQTIEETSGISWRITNTECKSETNLQLSANRVYNEDCELSLGQSYTLECDGEGNTGSPNYNGWWKANFLTIENSVYCEYSDGKEIMNITITGKAYGLKLIFSCIC